MKRWIALVPAALLLFTLAAPGGAASDAAGGKNTGEEPEALVLNYDSDGNGIFQNLEDAIKGATATARFPVIVQLKEAPGDGLMALLSTHAGGFATTAKWDIAINGFSASLTANQIKLLAKLPVVKSVEQDLVAHAFMGTASTWTGVTKARTDFGVDGSRDASSTTYSTSDVVVAVLDTGIDKNHIDLDGGKVLAFRDEINGQAVAYDDHDHGTHVSGIIAGTGEGNSAYKGVAPGAALVGIKVLNSAGSGTSTQIINGINWMIANRATYNIKIGNMSLGASGCSNGTDSISTAVNNAVTNGITMFVAAGNDGPKKCSIGAPGAAANAITVGASVDPGEKGWALAYFSSRGLTADGRLKPDIVTPGFNITAPKRASMNGYVTMSGTSMATPFAAGVAALMLDANPALTTAGIKSNMYANVEDWGPTGHDLDYGRGLLLAYNAIKQAKGGVGTFDDGITHSFHTGSLAAVGAFQEFSFNVTSAATPIAVTMIMNNWTGASTPDFDLFLFNPSAVQVASSTGTTRQETILYQPVVTGTYKVRVSSFAGTGPFFFDRSWK